MAAVYHIKGFLRFEEYLECHTILAATRRLWIRSVLTLCGSGLTLMALLPPSGQQESAPIIGGIGLGLVLYGLVVSPIQFRYRVKYYWNRYPKLKDELEMRVTEDGVDSMDDRGQPAHTAWKSFLRFRESPSLFLLYLAPLAPLCIPKRLVPDGDLAGLRARLSTAIRDHEGS